MKKLLALLLVLVMVVALVACGGNDNETEAPTDASQPASDATENNDNTDNSDTPVGTDLKVAVFYYTYSDTYISSVRTALDAQLDALGVTYQDFDSNGNQTTQNEAIQTAIADGYNLLIVNMVTSGSSDTAKGIMELAGDVPVIFFNRAVDEDGVEASASVLNAYENIAFVGTDAPEAGHLQGKMIGEYVLEHYDELDLNGDGKISYARFKGDEANVEAIYRTQYGVEDANAVLTAAGKPELVYFDANNTSGYQVDLNGHWSAAAALDYMNTKLSQYNEGQNNMIELIICNNDNMAEGCISALESAGYNNGTGKTIPVFGVDATDSAKELIANGKMTGTVKQDAEGMAAAIAQIAKAVGEVYYFIFSFLIKKMNLKTPGREDDDQEVKLYTKADVNAKRENASKNGEAVQDELSELITRGLGGKKNIDGVDCCATRLRCTVVKPDLVDDALLRSTGASGVIHKGSGIQIVYGPHVTVIKSNLEDYLETAPDVEYTKDNIDSMEETKEVQEEHREEKVTKTITVSSPITGIAADLATAPDEAFAGRMMGDGAVVTPQDALITAPEDGEVVFVFDTKHAIGFLTDSGLSMLLHIGIDTVKLEGKGFEVLVENGQKVKKGDPMMRLDLSYLSENAPSLASPVLCTELEDNQKIRLLKEGEIKAGEPLFAVDFYE